jgi:hypothetical protein
MRNRRIVMNKEYGTKWKFSCLRYYFDIHLGWGKGGSWGKLQNFNYSNASTEDPNWCYTLMFILPDWVKSNVPLQLRTRAAVALPRTSPSLPRTFIGLVYSQFELIKIKLQKVNYTFLLFFWELINLMSVKDLFRKSLPPPPTRVAQANPIAAQKTPWLAH